MSGATWVPEDGDVFVVEYVQANARELGTMLWTVTALNPDDAAEKFRAVNSIDPINRVLFDTGWHRATEQEEYIPPAQETRPSPDAVIASGGPYSPGYETAAMTMARLAEENGTSVDGDPISE